MIIYQEEMCIFVIILYAIMKVMLVAEIRLKHQKYVYGDYDIIWF